MSLAVGQKSVSLLIVWSLALSLFMGIGLFATPAAAQNCARSGAPTAGDWTVSDVQVCEGIVIVMDGNLIVTGTGDLTIRNGGLKFVEDTTHVYGISVAAGGRLTVESSTVWTETDLVNPYLKLTVSISGTLTARASTFAFPGTLDSAAGSVVTFSQGSVIRGTEADVSTIFGTLVMRDENNDPPGLTFTSSTVSFFASRIERLYENSSLVTPDVRQAIRLQGSTTFTAVDTFLGIDFNPDVRLHNTLALAGTSNAYLYGVTTDAAQNPGTQDQWVSAITATAGTRADVYRWANVRVVDANGVPVPAADVDAEFSGPESGPATFRDNGGATNPPAAILNYLGKTAATWDDTGSDGTARMPLLSDWVDSATVPNSRFVGTFTLIGTLGADSGTATLTFAAYPAMTNATASSPVTVRIGTLVQPLPDLTPNPPTFTPAAPKAGQTVAIDAPIANQGAGGAANVLVRIFDGVTQLHEETIPFIGPGGQQTVSTSLVNATAGQHVIRVSVDPSNAIIESSEANNLRGFQLSVTALGPDLEVDVSFDPDPGFLNNPVRLIAGVTNIGDRNATSVRVNFYVQETMPDPSSTPVGTTTIPFINITAAASVNWTPTSLGTFRVWAWVDPLNVIPEPAPYLEDNNLNSNLLAVNPSPDLVTFVQDLSTTDPFPKIGDAITIEAVVRNNGQAGAGPFRVDFSVDGQFVGFNTNAGGLAAGGKWTTTMAAPAFTTCGAHSIGINVDSLNQVNEGSLYELNNRVTSTVLVYPSQVFSWASGSITSDQAFSSSLEITGPVSISDAQINVVQDQDVCGRYYVKVLSGGSLTLTNAQLTSNWPLSVFVAGGGTMTATGSTLNLDVQGKGAMYSRGVLDVRSSTINGDVVARGTRAYLRGDAFGGSLLHVNTAQTSQIWDSTFPGVATIQLASDAPGQAVPDFDIRNVTFNAALTGQLVFSGDQWVQLTSVGLTKAGDWWTGMLTQGARVTRYWWATVEAVDGTGTRIQDPTTVVTLRRFNPTTLAFDPVPNCAAGECYFNSNNTWPVGVPTGQLLYRAATEDRYGSAAPSIRATYLATGSAFIEGQLRLPDQDVSALVMADSTITLVFSELTPDLSISRIDFVGQGTDDVQPINRPLTITATVSNTGEIITRNVFVYFYSVDVDLNGDGYMDNSNGFYVSTGAHIGQTGPFNVPARNNVTFSVSWTPTGQLEGTRVVSAVVDPSTGPDPRAGGTIAELDETNNIRVRTLTVFTWPDLSLAVDPFRPIEPAPIVNNPSNVRVAVTNAGTNTATSAVIRLFNATTDAPISAAVNVTIPKGQTVEVTLVWTPTVAGTHTIRVRASTPVGDIRNTDYNLADNQRDKAGIEVRSQPELTIALRGAAPSPFRNQPFDVNVTVTNTGQTTAPDIVVVVVWQDEPTRVRGALFNLDVPAGSWDLTVRATLGIPLIGDTTILAVVDANSTVQEPNEDNNVATIPITVIAPQGTINLQAPAPGQTFEPGQRISVFGKVLQTDGTHIPGVNVTAALYDANDVAVPGASGFQLSASNDGTFVIGITVPTTLGDGTYRLRVSSVDVSISPAELNVRVLRPVGFFDQTFIGLPVWIWLIVIIGAAAAIGGGTAYVKFVGLGKLVECGECGAFIAEDSTKCPKCGVEFEKDMAKCSNCQAWIPVDVKQCPECGVEFATGKVEMADYEAQMRTQYEEVKRRFREEASRDLGRSLSEREFEDWWRAQPTFVTFEDWLREEEEMRRMGSKPCPVCTTLNSVTATVCHKCGTLLKEELRKPAARPPAATRPRPAASPTEAAPTEEAPEGAPPTEAIPKKVVKKPIVGAPVVQKKVIKRPLEEKEGEESGEEGEEI